MTFVDILPVAPVEQTGDGRMDNSSYNFNRDQGVVWWQGYFRGRGIGMEQFFQNVPGAPEQGVVPLTSHGNARGWNLESDVRGGDFRGRGMAVGWV